MTNTETAALARIRQMADHWEQHLPEVIRTPAVVSALRAALESAAPTAGPAVVEPPADRAAARDRIADAVQPLLMDTLPKAIAAAQAREITDAVLAVLPEPADRAAVRDALRRADEAEARVAAMERAMESTAADALKHRGCHRELMAQCQRAERAEAELRRMADETATGPAQSANAEETTDDAARRFARRLLAVELLCSGRPGYHTLTVKQVLTAISEADDEPAAGARQDGAQ